MHLYTYRLTVNESSAKWKAMLTRNSKLPHIVRSKYDTFSVHAQLQFVYNCCLAFSFPLAVIWGFAHAIWLFCFNMIHLVIFWQDCKNLGGRNICVMTDNNLVKLPAVEVVCEALEKEGLKYSVYDKCRVEPTDKR